MEQRAAIKLFHDNGFSPASIAKQLAKVHIGERKVYRTIKRLRETGTIADRKRSGRPRSVRTPALVNKVKCRLVRNPKQSINHMAYELKVKRSTLQRVVKFDLGLRPYKLTSRPHTRSKGQTASKIKSPAQAVREKKNWTISSFRMRSFSAYQNTTIVKTCVYMQRHSKIFLKI